MDHDGSGAMSCLHDIGHSEMVPSPQKGGGNQAYDVEKLLGQFRRYQTRRNLSPLTIRHRCHQAMAFSNYLAATGTATLLTATAEHVEAWLDTRELDPGTRYTYLCYLRALYRFAVREGHCKASPIDLIEPPKRPKRLPRPTDRDDLEIATDEADPRMRAWLLLGSLQGLRVSSIARLTVEGIDRHAMTLRIWTKGDKEHAMPLHPQVLAALDAYGMPSSGFVFRKQTVGCEDQPLSPSTVSRYIGEHFHRLGSAATSHQNRHRFCSDVVEITGDITVAADLAGHANVATTQLYVKVLAERGRSAMALLGRTS